MKQLWWVLLSVLTAGAATAGPMAPEDVPFSLKPWVKWTLATDPQFGCPYRFNNHADRRCAWATPMQLSLTGTGGEFSATWQVYAGSWITLPGDDKHWPQDVTLDDNPATVTDRGGRPSIWIEAGMARVQGHFTWSSLPESVWLPPDIGIAQLTVNGVVKPFPSINEEGRLWLTQGDSTAAAQDNDSLALQVHRLISDEIPLQIVTRIELDAAGRQREVVLQGAVLADSIPLALNSALPARLDADGAMRVQLRPGHWIIEVTTRHPREVTELALPEAIDPWPASELWAFDARNHLRLLDVQGVTQIDPNQTTLPEEWKSHPAYRVSSGETMTFAINRRGDPQPEPDRLTLNRQLWLDFDGGGYTFSDSVTGTMTAGWRLDLNTPMQLGRVAVDGQPQLITRAGDSSNSGVEVRRGSLNLSADGRYDGNIRQLPAVGWDHDFQQVGATLHLPPGWRLFSVSGVDDKRSTGAWLHGWSMLDVFLVGITALVMFHLFDLGTALLALATLAMVWFEPDAPRYVWLNLVAAMALLRVLPQNRLRSVVVFFRNLVILALIVIIVPFLVNQVRTGLFPQLENPWRSVASDVGAIGTAGRVSPASAPPMAEQDKTAMADAAVPAEAPQPGSEVVEEQITTMAREMKQRTLTGSRPLDILRSDYSSQNYQEFDPKANVQTGPGLPRWGWTDVPLTWHGSVTRHQQVGLMLLSPRQHLFMNLLRVVLVSLLALGFLRASFGANIKLPKATSAAAVLAILAIATTLPRQAHADEYPSQELLNELRSRLTAAPDCLPACAKSPRLRINVQGDQLQLRLEVHAIEHVAVPLPGSSSHWLPAEVSVDGIATDGLARTPAGELLLRLGPGAHQVVMSGPLPARSSVQLPMPLTPQRVEIESVSGWQIDGIHEDGTSDAQLVFSRDAQQSTDSSSLKDTESTTLPTFARIERTLRLGLEWRVETRILRLSAPDSAIVMEVPLLPGESITTDNVRVVDGKALINLAAQEAEARYDSVLEKQPEIRLTAPDTTGWVELWRADVSPVLHASMSGIPVVHHQTTDGNWLPEWRPWPGESVSIAVNRPEGVEGSTFTIDASKLVYTPGERATDVSLSVDVRSSQGSQHNITLPRDAELQSATINGVAQPIRQQGRVVTLPLAPGAQSFVLSWREPQGLRNHYHSSPVDLGASSVNANVQVQMPVDRWVLFTRGPLLGPAVMFWGELLVIVLVAFALARIPLTPLRTWHWLLLGIGLSQITIAMSLIVVGWLLVLGWRAQWRAQWPASGSKTWFNLGQLGIAALTIAALICLYNAIRQGLLGAPEMQIGGNASHAQQLNWYQDHAAHLLPQATITSVPLIVYHLLMLAWALWLAFALVRWLRWGWSNYSHGGIWRSFTLFKRRDVTPTAST